jgi:glycosyltransferase involved in cell wall biosynthesis
MSTAGRKYVLLTSAYNEEAYIGRTIESIAGQTLLPQRWVIVNDGSADRTDEIVQKYAAKYPFIRLVRIHEKHARNFGAQVVAINRGSEQLRDVDYEFIANVDSDLSFEPTYYSNLLQKFDEDPNLGLAGGFIFEEAQDGVFRSRLLNSEHSVGHAVQMLRRECYESIGGWVAMPHGGQDWVALVTAQMRGWRIKAFRDLPVFHHRPTGSADRRVRNLFREGRMDYSLGSYPPFEILKLVRRFPFKPYVLGSLVRLCGFLWGYWLREERPVSQEFVRFLRSEQKNALRELFLLGPVKETLPKAISCRAEPVGSEEIPSDKPPVSHDA